MPTTKLIRANCLKRMRSMEPNSIDTIITDPPYGLEFMGKVWDHGSPGPAFWRAALRVVKPGAFLLCFGGTRTFHRLACSIEDAGWELRDCIMWLYGTGFPKSLNISKAIDKAAGVKRRIIGPPTRSPGVMYATDKGWNNNRLDPGGGHQTAPATKEARFWDGYGTALKPAWEPIIVAMKPLDGTFANNAKKHGVAGFNISACRVGMRTKNESDWSKTGSKASANRAMSGANYARKPKSETGLGRWPANLIHDGSDNVLEKFPISKDGVAVNRNRGKRKPSIVNYADHNGKDIGYGGGGSAARFFYCAKASSSERGKGNNHPTVKPLKLMEYLCLLTRTPKGGTVLDPFMGSGTTGLACRNTKRSFIGIEKSREYFKIAKHRIRGK